MREEYNRGISLLQILKQSDTAGEKKRRFGVGDVPPNIFLRGNYECVGNWTWDLGVEITHPLSLHYQVHLNIVIQSEMDSNEQFLLKKGNSVRQLYSLHFCL